MYETQDSLAPGIISWQNGNRPDLAFPLEKLLFTKAVPVRIEQVMDVHRQANVPQEIRGTCC